MIGVSLVSPKGTEKQSSCLLAYLEEIDYRQNVDDKTHHFYSLAQSVVTTETILSSVSSGRVKLSDPISKVVCKPFKEVSWTPLRVTHIQHGRIHACFLVLVLSGAHVRQLGVALPNPGNGPFCPGGAGAPTK